METVLIILIIAAALAYLVYRVIGEFKNPHSSAGCSHCDLPHKQKADAPKQER